MATLHKLTAKAVEALSEPGRHSDGGGLYLVVRGPQSRSWVFIWKDKGRPREAGLGPAKGKDKDGITLSEARDRAAEFRTRLREGVDPLKAKEAERAASVTFGPFADEYLAGIKTSFKHPHSIADWKRDIEKRCAVLRPMVIADIGTDDVLEVLRPIWTTRHRTATELRGRIERILDAAKA
ncbi:MAG TPA: Arm DNA-binding domain-containing protein, partial [Nitrobacter sp.]|nr:Arm DNA-binding domain-containing protein [Nitrobacter sp.]